MVRSIGQPQQYSVMDGPLQLQVSLPFIEQWSLLHTRPPRMPCIEQVALSQNKARLFIPSSRVLGLLLFALL